MIRLTDGEAKLVASALKSYMKSPDGMCHATYCTDGYRKLRNIAKRMEESGKNERSIRE
jgi:hypothetical protein